MKVPVKIPHSADILIEKGQKVDFTTPLLKRKGNTRIQIPLADLMGFAPDKIFLKVKKTIGDMIRKGDLLAENKSFMSAKRYKSQVEGILKEINHVQGVLIIEQESDENTEISCYFQGEVAEINDGYIELKVQNAHKAQTQDPVEFMGAEMYYASPDGIPFSEDDINGKGVFALSFNSMDHTKVEALGAQALILEKKLEAGTSITQIVLQTREDVEIVHKNKYPFFIVGPEPNTLYFYE
ncbi:hypothetical protein KBD81_05165 [Candidatus Woesebacteria bacterium]|nr:hypothetical protein [Candidatus Woesebacteria bacterium]